MLVKTKGGKRKGAGRKPAPYQTKTISFRVRVDFENSIKKTVKDKIIELSKETTKTKVIFLPKNEA